MKLDFVNRRVLFIVIGVIFFGGYFCFAKESPNDVSGKEFLTEDPEETLEETTIEPEDETQEDKGSQMKKEFNEEDRAQDQESENQVVEPEILKITDKQEEEGGIQKKDRILEKDKGLDGKEKQSASLKQEEQQVNEEESLQRSSVQNSSEEKDATVLTDDEDNKIEKVNLTPEEEEKELEKIVINEVVIGDDLSTKNDFVELYNYSSKEIDLEGFSLKKRTSGGSKSNLISSSKFKGKIGPGKFFVIKNANYTGEILSELSFSGKSYSIAKNNRVYLYNKEEKLVNFVGWGACEEKCEVDLSAFKLVEGVSLSRKRIDKNFEHKKLFELTGFATPGKKNVFSSEVIYPEKISFSEILPNPEGVDKGSEMIELKSGEEFSVDLNGWFIENGVGKRFALKGFSIGAKKFFVVKIENSSFVIRNSKEKLMLINPAEKIVDVVEIIGSAPSDISWGVDKSGSWSWNREKTFGADNRINILPKIKLKSDKKIYRNIYAEFDASDSYDEDGDKLKFIWDFDDGHRSYLFKTKHIFKKKDTYNVLLKVSDGYGSSEKRIKIKVKSYPRRKLRLTKITPNPAGRDKNNEEIEIFNYSNKKLNLKNFYLATGAINKKFSSLTKHKIKKNLFIKPGESIVIKNKSRLCAFSLLNKGGRISLLYPDGKTVDKLEYIKEKIFDDEYFEKRDSGWIWVRNFNLDNSDQSKKETVRVKSYIDIKQFIEGAFYNQESGLCENLTKVRIDNWKSAQAAIVQNLFRSYLKSERLESSRGILYENN